VDDEEEEESRHERKFDERVERNSLEASEHYMLHQLLRTIESDRRTSKNDREEHKKDGESDWR